MLVINKETDIETKELFPGVVVRKGIDRDIGAKSVTMGHMSIAPGCGLPKHKHIVEDCMIIIQGQGILYIDEVAYPFQAGDQILVPTGTCHSLQNTGEECLILVFTYPSVDVARILVP